MIEILPFSSGNQIKSLPKEFGMLSKLSLLAINTNELEELPESFGCLTQLQACYANRNKIREIPSTLIDCSSLKVLNLANNPIQTITQDMKDEWNIIIDIVEPEAENPGNSPRVNLSGTPYSTN